MATKREELDKALKGQGCLGKAADDEPVFILRAQDITADALVDFWAQHALSNGCDDAKVREARNLAQRMREWPNRKMPD